MRNFQFPGRSVVMARNGMAATSHTSATLAAVRVLEEGGTAMDAAIAACAVQCVVEPGATGIGGDCFALYSQGGGDDIVAYNGAGWTPRALTPEALRERGVTSLDRSSAHVVTVPGAIDAWVTLRERFGRLPMTRLLEPAIRFAEEGYAVGPRVAADWAQQAGCLSRSPAARRTMLREDGTAPAAGSVHRQPALARTLRAIGEDGRSAFYEGPVAAEMVAYLASLGGLHTLDDFHSYRGEFVTPIASTFKEHRIVECPPPGQGVIALLMLKMLERADMRGNPLSAERVQLEIDVARAAYAIRDQYLCDPRIRAVDVEKLMSEAFAAKTMAGMRNVPAYASAPHRDTIYLCVVDRDRNCASFINSLFFPFGGGLMTPESGVMLHNRGQSFVLEPGHPNEIGPRKRPMHTIIPGMATRGGRVEMVFGVMGGGYQAMGHAHFVSKVLGYGLNIQAACDLPRVFPMAGSPAVEAEATLPTDVRAELEHRGYRFVPTTYAALGGAQAIRIDWEAGCLHGASDHRKDGCALGY